MFLTLGCVSATVGTRVTVLAAVGKVVAGLAETIYDHRTPAAIDHASSASASAKSSMSSQVYFLADGLRSK